MSNVDTVLAARWVVPVQPAGLVLNDHAIALEAGRIADVLPIQEARGKYASADWIDLAHHIVTPGLINAHTHAAMSLLRGVGDDMPLMRWLTERIWPLEKALVSAEFVEQGSFFAAVEMLRAGQTCCSDMYFFPEEAARGLRAAGMRAAVGIITIDFPSAFANDADDYLRKGLAARDALRDDPLVSFTLAPHAPYTVNDAALKKIATLAEELDLPIEMHVHETQDEIQGSLDQYGVRPLARLEQLGLVSERLLAVHAVHLNDAEIAQLARAGATVVHCPTSNLKLASGVAPAAKLAAAGINIAFGTDGSASNNRLDLLAEARLAGLLAKGAGCAGGASGAANDATALPATKLLQAATLDAARALGLDRHIGSIETGKDADLVAFAVDSIEALPCFDPYFDPVAHLFYAAGREHVSDVWVRGVHVVQKRLAVAAEKVSAPRTTVEQMQSWRNRLVQLLSH